MMQVFLRCTNIRRTRGGIPLKTREKAAIFSQFMRVLEALILVGFHAITEVTLCRDWERAVFRGFVVAKSAVFRGVWMRFRMNKSSYGWSRGLFQFLLSSNCLSVWSVFRWFDVWRERSFWRVLEFSVPVFWWVVAHNRAMLFEQRLQVLLWYFPDKWLPRSERICARINPVSCIEWSFGLYGHHYYSISKHVFGCFCCSSCSHRCRNCYSPL